MKKTYGVISNQILIYDSMKIVVKESGITGYTCLSQMRIRIHFLIIFVRYSCLLLQLFIIFKA